jgi:hypothetical protein
MGSVIYAWRLGAKATGPVTSDPLARGREGASLSRPQSTVNPLLYGRKEEQVARAPLTSSHRYSGVATPFSEATTAEVVRP